MSFLFTLIVQSLLSTASPALAKSADEGVPVRVVVRDDAKTPIATAVVRHPQEADRHRVNAVDGSWEASVLYMPDGTELQVFVKKSKPGIGDKGPSSKGGPSMPRRCWL